MHAAHANMPDSAEFIISFVDIVWTGGNWTTSFVPLHNQATSINHLCSHRELGVIIYTAIQNSTSNTWHHFISEKKHQIIFDPPHQITTVE